MIHVWAGIYGDHVVGPHFFDEGVTVTGAVYLNLLTDDRHLTRYFANIGAREQQMWWLHDGAPAHRLLEVTGILNHRFRHRWIGRGGPTEWPAKSPDLNIMDIFVWAFVKDKCYTREPTTRADMIERIRNAFTQITPAMLRRSRENYETRLYCLRDQRGGHFEQLMRRHAGRVGRKILRLPYILCENAL